MSETNNAKKYPFPLRTFLSYIIFCIVGIVALDIQAGILIRSEIDGFVDTLIGIGVMLGAFIVILLICVSLFFILGSPSYKIYRGTGLYIFGGFVNFLCIAVFIGTIVYMEVNEISYAFFNVLALFSECMFPLALKGKPWFGVRYCKSCGLINTLQYVGSEETSMGTKMKFHTEGGYYRDVKANGRIGDTSLEMTTQQYVPKTSVFDGVFETKQNTKTYCCHKCGNVVYETAIRVTKIGN